MPTESYPAGLWVVVTPIGNLGDMTPRALRALESADAVLCEDTRRTGSLLSTLGISAKLERLDANSSQHRIAEIVERLKAGETLALVTDAGTPAISDPGSELVANARSAQIAVTPFPGVSAVTALLSVAGFTETCFTFAGFFPRKSGEREAVLDDAMKSKTSSIFVWYESPHRINDALLAIKTAQDGAKVVAAKELTKLHERFFVGTASDVASQVISEIAEQGEIGEWSIAVLFQRGINQTAENPEWEKALRCMLDAQVAASEAARRVSQYFGVNKNQVYERALALSGKK